MLDLIFALIVIGGVLSPIIIVICWVGFNALDLYNDVKTARTVDYYKAALARGEELTPYEEAYVYMNWNATETKVLY